MASKRMVRLTRTQLDLTTKTLLPAHVKTGAMDALPPDPLQTNYEYAELIGLNRQLFNQAAYVGNYTMEFSAEPFARFADLYGKIDIQPYRAFLAKCNTCQCPRAACSISGVSAKQATRLG